MQLFSRIQQIDAFLLPFRHALGGIVDAGEISVETSIADGAGGGALLVWLLVGFVVLL
jgi:hypothetical protein